MHFGLVAEFLGELAPVSAEPLQVGQVLRSRAGTNPLLQTLGFRGGKIDRDGLAAFRSFLAAKKYAQQFSGHTVLRYPSSTEQSLRRGNANEERHPEKTKTKSNT